MIMKRNAYPDRHLVIKQFLSKVFAKNSGTAKEVESKRTFQIFLPYIGSFSSKTERSITKIFKQYIPNCNFRIVTKRNFQLINFWGRLQIYVRYLQRYLHWQKRKRHQKTRFCEHFGISAHHQTCLKPILDKNIHDF